MRKFDDLLKGLFGHDLEGLKKIFIDSAAQRFRRSWGVQPRDERNRRMKVLLDMVAEMGEINRTTRLATAWCEMSIEAVITGSHDDLDRFAEMMLFPGETYQQEMANVFGRFRILCLEAALAGRAFEAARMSGDGRPS